MIIDKPKERPILFNTDMVRAILYHDKTETRRPIFKLDSNFCQKRNTLIYLPNGDFYLGNGVGSVCGYANETELRNNNVQIKHKFGNAGDLLYVRETFAYFDGISNTLKKGTILYKEEKVANFINTKWTPSIHMKKEYSRIKLEVVSVIPERIQDISAEDCIKEGIVQGFGQKYGLPNWDREDCCSTPKEAYKKLWISCYGKKSWEDNIWVWVLNFKKI